MKRKLTAALAALGMTLAIGAATTGGVDWREAPDSEAWAGNIGGLLGGGRTAG